MTAVDLDEKICDLVDVCSAVKGKKGKEVFSSLCYKRCSAMGTHVPYGITECYLPPGRGDIPAFTPAN